MEKKWWKEAVVYQVYPRSFLDSSGDGVGDLRGIIQKLDYIRDLGANVIWLCPIYDSPNADNGYDIRDYRKIMKEFGTMRDFEELLAQAHQKGLKIVMDLVVNHTSDEHEWFQKSRQSPANQYRGYYIWKDGKDGGEPNNWGAVFGGSVWKFDDSAKQYYMHLFAEKQPDLNWENPEVRKNVYDMMTWWLEKGVDGFRMDVINAISKDQRFPDGEVPPGQKYGDGWKHTTNGPRVHEFLQEMHREVLSKYDVMTVGETGGITTADAQKYAGFDRHELNMVFQFEHVDLGGNENGKWNDQPVALRDLKEIITRWQTELNGKAWNSLYFGNHDQPRSVSRFGSDGKFREKSAKLLATLLLTLQGTPFIYQGEEIGMTNVPFQNIGQFRDIETLNAYRELNGRYPGEEERVMRYIRAKSRDNARTPMQWDDTPNAGFSRAEPWIPVNPNYRRINVSQNLSDPDSVFHYYRKMIRLRRKFPALIYGFYRPLLEGHEQVICFEREYHDQTLLMVLNFSKEAAQVRLPDSVDPSGTLLISNDPACENRILSKTMALPPFESRVYLLS
ncbi:glycoside hydrolase family 13 protein [Caproicibacter sp.]|uniref:glycoside hydrolase family 13 protein n=1 Tax=Caproicibacter sp. TaxID=2814884 RepID=UPI00398989A6